MIRSFYARLNACRSTSVDSLMDKRTFLVLLIDGCEADYEAARKELYLSSKNDRFDFVIEWRQTLSHGLKALSQNAYDAILLDISLSDGSGIEGLKNIRASAPDTPVVILTALDDETTAIKTVQAGAQDYIVKGKYPDVLFRSLVYAILREDSLRQIEKSERQTRSSAIAKSAFFANMSHEIRNPLTSIIGYSEALMGTGLDAKEKDRALSAVFANGQHLLKLINDILDLSKMDAGELKIEASAENLSLFLRDLQHTFSQAAKKKGVDFQILFEPPVPAKLETDFFRLRQILYNLLGNAIKFTSEGFVKLTLRIDRDSETISFEVKDSGVGISDKAKDELFKSFSQGEFGRAKEFGGTGLGLVIARELAERLKGSIHFKSRLGIGSVFTLTLPLGALGQESLSSEIPNLEEIAKTYQTMDTLKLSGNVLVADDLEDNRDLISLLLRKVGLHVETAKDGAVAFQMASEKQFDLILLDMEMPNMSGQEVTKSLRLQGLRTPIIAITAMMLEESLAECLSVGCDACLPKPFSQQELYACILKFLGEEAKELEEVKDTNASLSVKNNELEKVRRNFIKRLSSRVEEIEAALEAKDLTKLKSEAHRLIGAGLFGFQDLSHFGGTLESLIIQEESGGLGLVESLVNKVKNEVSRISIMNSESLSDSHQPVPDRQNQESTVIVLDDDDVHLKVVCRVLNVKGFIAAPARTGEEALEMCNDGSVSLLIVALETTRAENYHVISQIRQKLKRNIPVIAMTNRLPSEVHMKLSEYHVQQLLVKPISRDELLGTIDSLITANLSEGAAAF